MGMYNSVSFSAVCKPGPGLDAWVTEMRELFKGSGLGQQYLDLVKRPDGLTQVDCYYYGNNSYNSSGDLEDHTQTLDVHTTEPFVVEDKSEECDPYVLFPKGYPAPKSEAMQFLLVEAFGSGKTVSSYLKDELKAALAAQEAWLQQADTQQ